MTRAWQGTVIWRKQRCFERFHSRMTRQFRAVLRHWREPMVKLTMMTWHDPPPPPSFGTSFVSKNCVSYLSPWWLIARKSWEILYFSIETKQLCCPKRFPSVICNSSVCWEVEKIQQTRFSLLSAWQFQQTQLSSIQHTINHHHGTVDRRERQQQIKWKWNETGGSKIYHYRACFRGWYVFVFNRALINDAMRCDAMRCDTILWQAKHVQWRHRRSINSFIQENEWFIGRFFFFCDYSGWMLRLVLSLLGQLRKIRATCGTNTSRFVFFSVCPLLFCLLIVSFLHPDFQCPL